MVARHIRRLGPTLRIHIEREREREREKERERERLSMKNSDLYAETRQCSGKDWKLVISKI